MTHRVHGTTRLPAQPQRERRPITARKAPRFAWFCARVRTATRTRAPAVQQPRAAHGYWRLLRGALRSCCRSRRRCVRRGSVRRFLRPRFLTVVFLVGLRLACRARAQPHPDLRCVLKCQREQVTASGCARWARARKRRAVHAWLVRTKVRALADALSKGYPRRAQRLLVALCALLPAAACVGSPNPAGFHKRCSGAAAGPFQRPGLSRGAWVHRTRPATLLACACVLSRHTFCQHFASLLRTTWRRHGSDWLLAAQATRA